jgi:hypothetical protein
MCTSCSSRLQDAGAPFARPSSVRSFVAAAAAVIAVLLSSGRARADDVPTPADAALRGTVETDAIREVPELKGARINRMRDESVSGVHVLDQTFDTDVSYRDAVRFYDRSLAGAILIERDQAATATGWLVKLDDGTVASVIVRNTQPTTIEVQKMVP